MTAVFLVGCFALDPWAQGERQDAHDTSSYAGGDTGAYGGAAPVLLRPADIEEGSTPSSRLSASAAAFIPLRVEDGAHVVGGLAPCATPGAAFRAAFPAAWFDNLCTADLAELLRLTVARERGRIPLTCSLFPVDYAAAVDRRCQVDMAYTAARAGSTESRMPTSGLASGSDG